MLREALQEAVYNELYLQDGDTMPPTQGRVNLRCLLHYYGFPHSSDRMASVEPDGTVKP